MQLARIKSNGDATFVLHERDGRNSENSRVEGENTRGSTEFHEFQDGPSAGNDVKSVSLRLRSRRRKGIPHRSPLFS
jgi:hypothetical protein